MTTHDRIIEILRATGRPGMEAVIDLMESSGYFTKPGGGHHLEEGGLAKHCLEVYETMKSAPGNFPSDSIAVTALFHDLGKVDGRCGHAGRSLRMLGQVGFQLTEEERFAIGHHHKNDSLSEFRQPLRRALSIADSFSTFWWKARHPFRKRHKR